MKLYDVFKRFIFVYFLYGTLDPDHLQEISDSDPYKKIQDSHPIKITLNYRIAESKVVLSKVQDTQGSIPEEYLAGTHRQTGRPIDQILYNNKIGQSYKFFLCKVCVVVEVLPVDQEPPHQDVHRGSLLGRIQRRRQVRVFYVQGSVP